jgi:hypothetical protein
MHPEILTTTIAGIEQAGGSVAPEADDLLRVNDEFTVSIVIARCTETAARTPSI